MKKVLIIVGDASETLDTLYPFYRLQEAGIEPVVAGPEKKTYQMVMHEVKPGWSITKEWEGYTIEAKIAFKDIRIRLRWDLLLRWACTRIYPGGSRSHSYYSIFLRQEFTHSQCLPWGGNTCPCRSCHGATHGHSPKVQVRPGDLRWHLRG